jgi:small subunit ribosomal protein S1
MDNTEIIGETGTTEETAKTAETHAGPAMNDLEQYEKSFMKIEPGQYLRGKIVKIDNEGVLVDVGYKTDGLIPPSEISDPDIAVGNEVDVVVLHFRDAMGELVLSKKRADLESAWKSVIDAFEKQEAITATCIEQVKGGLIVDIGLRGFVPASHVDTRPVRDLSDFVGEALRLKVLELDRSRRKVVLSRRKVLEEERDSSREATLKNLYEGEIRTGRVARITNFGAFVNLGGVDGLIHISELSWRRVKHPSEVVKVGDEMEVLVLKLDKKKEKISLSLRQARPDPWHSVGEHFKSSAVVTGKVSKIAKNYVFVELVEGVEGLIPLMELSEDRSARPEDLLKLGQEVQVKILEIKPQERRIILSIRQAAEDASRAEYSEYISGRGSSTIGDLLKGKMEEKELQDIIAPKAQKEEHKAAAPPEKTAPPTPKPPEPEQKPAAPTQAQAAVPSAPPAALSRPPAVEQKPAAPPVSQAPPPVPQKPPAPPISQAPPAPVRPPETPPQAAPPQAQEQKMISLEQKPPAPPVSQAPPPVAQRPPAPSIPQAPPPPARPPEPAAEHKSPSASLTGDKPLSLEQKPPSTPSSPVAPPVFDAKPPATSTFVPPAQKPPAPPTPPAPQAPPAPVRPPEAAPSRPAEAAAPPTEQKIISLEQKPPTPPEPPTSSSILSALDDPELEEALDNVDPHAEGEASSPDESSDPMQLIRDSLSGKLDEGEKSE